MNDQLRSKLRTLVGIYGFTGVVAGLRDLASEFGEGGMGISAGLPPDSFYLTASAHLGNVSEVLDVESGDSDYLRGLR